MSLLPALDFVVTKTTVTLRYKFFLDSMAPWMVAGKRVFALLFIILVQMKQLLSVLLLVGCVVAVNSNCALIVPKDPLTATGLATPYRLVALNPKDGPCHQANADQATFVQSTIIDTDTGNLFVYNPLVIDNGTTPAVVPKVTKFSIGN